MEFKYLFSSLLSFFAVICLAFFAVPKIEGREHLFNCLVYNLSERSLLDEALTYRYEFRDGLNVENFCDTVTLPFRTSMEKVFRDQLAQEAAFADHVDCIWEKVEPLRLDDLYLLSRVYRDDTSMPEFRRRKALSEADLAIHNKLDHAKKLCLPELMFNQEFEKEIKNDKEYNMKIDKPDDDYVDVETLQDDYCQLNYLIDSKFINNDIYNIKINPENIDVSKLDCKHIWLTRAFPYDDGMKDTMVNVLNEPSSKTKDCIGKVVFKTNYAAVHLTTLFISSSINTTAELREAARDNFVSAMTSMYTEAMECVE